MSFLTINPPVAKPRPMLRSDAGFIQLGLKPRAPRWTYFRRELIEGPAVSE